MSQIFISYRRKDFWFVDKLHHELNRALDTNIFVDLFGIRTPEYAEEILLNLRTSDLVLLVLSEHTFDPHSIQRTDDWIRREMRETLRYDKPLYLIRLGETPFPQAAFLPPDIAACAYRLGIQIQPESFPTDFAALINQIIQTPGLTFQRRDNIGVQQSPLPSSPTVDFHSALNMIEDKRYAEAIDILKQLQVAGMAWNQDGIFDLNELIKRLQYQHDLVTERMQAKRDYDVISTYLKMQDMNQAFELWKLWVSRFPQYIEELDEAEYQAFSIVEEQVNRAHYSKRTYKDSDVMPKAIEFNGTYNRDWQPYISNLEHSTITDINYSLVPAGSFLMGSDEGLLDETPIHRQYFQEPFWVMQTPVTNAHWRLAVKAKVVNEPTTILGNQWFHNPEMSSCPVVGINWMQANVFARWLGGSLLSEEEWEYVARGVESLRYTWGNQFDSTKAHYRYNSNNIPRDVNTATNISWVGAMDLIGNISEWLSSKYLPYPTQDNKNANLGNSISVRGGSWRSDEAQLKATHRNWYGPLISLDTLGLRCKLPITPPKK
ncbi:MAG: SUMF1/EgtB/PvdO family nonheme iron enzyme [Phototrophicaceae bacterium]